MQTHTQNNMKAQFLCLQCKHTLKFIHNCLKCKQTWFITDTHIFLSHTHVQFKKTLTDVFPHIHTYNTSKHMLSHICDTMACGCD